MIKIRISLLCAASLLLLLSSCSPVNSVAPFDDKQAAIVARSMLPPGYEVKRQK